MSDVAQDPAVVDHATVVTPGANLANSSRNATNAPHRSPAAEPAAGADALAGRDGSSDNPASRHPADPAKQKPRREEAPKDAEERESEPPQGLSARLRSHWIAISVAALVLVGGAIGGFFWYQHSLNFASTDDAFVDGRPVMINPQVTGSIVAVPVTDNQIVRAGDLLLQIDERDYVAADNLANAQIEQARASVVNFDAQIFAQESQIVQARTQVVSAQATMDFSKDQNVRYQDLVQKGAGTAQRAQQASSELQSTGAAVSSADAALKVAERQINVLKAQKKGAEAQIAQAEAQKATAQANLSRTKIYATVDSRVTRLTAALGQLATQAQAVMILVPLDVWVTANFKETQLASIKVGQRVDIEIDAFGKSFPGRIDSLQSGSGTAFSLLPAQNATGNYVKTVQRIPVKITFDERPPVQLGPGMSVVPTVTIR